MKRAHLMVVMPLIAVALLAISVVSYGQAPSNPRVPDYTGWLKNGEANAEVVLNGKPATLFMEQYQHTDMVNLRRYILSLIYNEQKNVWLAILTEQTGQRQPGGNVVTKNTYYYIFEHNGTVWMLAEDLSGSQNIEEDINEVLRMRYGLEFR